MAFSVSQMKPEERLAYEYLLSLQLGAVAYEPDGNRPPDFAINKRVAVEVRRLNQNEVTPCGHRGLEETQFALCDKIGNLLSSLGPSDSGVSWFVHYDFKRPLPHWKILRSGLLAYLREFKADSNRQVRKELSKVICESFELTLLRARNKCSQFFVLGGYSDNDSGGWTLAKTEKNLRICIEEKTRLVAPFRHQYPEWWLVLLDRIGYGLSAHERELYCDAFRFDHNWQKIILLNPLNPTGPAFELP